MPIYQEASSAAVLNHLVQDPNSVIYGIIITIIISQCASLQAPFILHGGHILANSHASQKHVN